MTSMRERIARAIHGSINARAIVGGTIAWDNLHPSSREWHLQSADAVLVEMTEPTKEMIRSVDHDAEDAYLARGRGYSAWHSMIRVARDGR